MAPVKRPRAESEVSAGADAAPASKRPRAVPSRVDTGLRAGAAAAGEHPPRQRPPLKRPPLAPRQPGQDRPPAAPRTTTVTVPKVDTHSRPAAVTDEQREAWRAARRQKLAERILRGRQGAAAACLGMDAEKQRSSAPSRPRVVASRLMQPKPTAAAASSSSAPAGTAAAAAKRSGSAAPASKSAPRPSTAAAARSASQGPPPPVGGIRLNKAAERRLTLIQARRQQAERDAERRSTLAAPAAASRPAARRPPPAPAAPRRQTFAGSRPAAPPARRPAAPCRPPTAPTRRSPRSAPGSAPRVTAVKTGMSKQRLAALARPKQPPQKKPSPPRSARIVKPVPRRPPVAPSVGGSLAPPTGLPNTMRRSLSAMHRSRSTSDRSAAVHRPAARDRAASVAAVPREDEADTAAMDTEPAVEATESETTKPPQQRTATPARHRQSAAAAATPARHRQSAATPALARQSTATPARARQSVTKSVAKPRLPSEQTLQERLEQWLARRGKQLSSFRHLHCFGKELSQPTPFRAKARRSAAPRVQRDPGSPPLRVTPTTRVSRASPGTPDTVVMTTPPALSAEKMAPQAPAAAAGEEQMDNVLSDLRELQELGLPSDQVVSWLERLSRDPASAGRARYWLCRATAAEQQGQLDAVLNCFRQASHAQAEPVMELISGLEQFVQRAAGSTGTAGTPQEASEDAENAPPTAAGTPTPARRRRAETRTPRRPLLDCSNMFDSSVIKYALIDDETVLKKLAALRLGSEGGGTPKGDILSIITPVRRSTRRKSLKPPANPHLALFDSVEAISESLRRSALFRKNSALMSP